MPVRVLTFLFLLFVLNSQAQTAVIDSLQKIVAQNKQDHAQAMAYISLGSEFARTDMAAAKRYSANAITLSKSLNLPIQLSAAYALQVTINAQINQTDSARYYLDLLKKLADKTAINTVQSNYNFAAGLFYRKQGNYKASLPFMLDGLHTLGKNDKIGLAGQYLNIGNNYSDMGDYRKAMANHLKALDIFEVLGNKRGMSFCYSAIGGDFIKLNQFSAALQYIQKSLDLKTELQDTRGKAASYISQGEIQEGLNQPAAALASYKEALKINKALSLTIEEAKTYLTLGKFYSGRKDITNATLYFNQGKELFKKLGDTSYLATVNAEIASMQKKIDQQKSVEQIFKSTINTSRKMGDKNTEIANYKHLADLYAKNQQFDKALKYNEKYHNVLDSVQNAGLQLQVAQLEQQYNFEKKEKEINLLKKNQQLDQANLKNQQTFKYATLVFIVMLIAIGLLVMARYRVVHRARRLVEIEKMRNTIARNLHDDIGSTLSSINILSKVAMGRAGGNVKIWNDLERIKNSSFSIMESMSDIVWAINPANDSFDKTILKMREFAAAILEPAGIGFIFEGDEKMADLKLGVDERKNVYLIFKEAVNNIAKYSGANLVNVTLQKTAHQFLLKISDNGTGFDSAKQYSGNGLKNMHSRTVEMHARFEIYSGPSAGTLICVTIPIT